MKFIHALKIEHAAMVLLCVPLVLIVFHIANILGLVPQKIVWTGRVTSAGAALLLGIVSISLNLALVFCGATQLGLLRGTGFRRKAEMLTLWMMWWLAGNTIVNLFSRSKFELIVFTPILLLLTICCYRIVAESQSR